MDNNNFKLQGTRDGQDSTIFMITTMDLSEAYRRDQFSVWACLFSVNLGTPKEQLPDQITQLLSEFEDVFQEPRSLPPQRVHDHHIPLKPVLTLSLQIFPSPKR